MKRSKLTVIAEVLVILAIMGAFFWMTLSSANAQEICSTTCEWIGNQWICTTVCY